MSEDINEIIDELNSKEGGAQKEIARLRADCTAMAGALLEYEGSSDCPSITFDGEYNIKHDKYCKVCAAVELAKHYTEGKP